MGDFLDRGALRGRPADSGQHARARSSVRMRWTRPRSGSSRALDDEPRAKVSVLVTLSGVYSSLDLSDRSLALLSRRWRWRGRSSRRPTRPRRKCWSSWRTRRCSPASSIEARAWVDRAEPVFAALGDTTSEHYAQALKIRGNLVRRGNNPDLRAGVTLLERSTALFRERYPESDGRLGALFYLAQTLRASNVPGRAEAIADEAVALAMHRVHMGFERPNAFSLRAAIRDSNGKLAEANADFVEAETGYLRTTGATHFLTLQNDGLRGMTLLEMGRGTRGSATSRHRPRHWPVRGAGARPTLSRWSGWGWPTSGWAASSAPSRCSRRRARCGRSVARRCSGWFRPWRWPRPVRRSARTQRPGHSSTRPSPSSRGAPRPRSPPRATCSWSAG